MRRPAWKNHQLQCGERLHLLSANRVLTCFVATLVSLATAARDPLPLASATKHHVLLLRCQHALRLQCAASERDGLRVSAAVIEL